MSNETNENNDILRSRQESFRETYNLLEEIGSGSGGTVRKAYHKHLQKYVVLKKIHAQAAQVLDKRTETDALKNLRHSYIPQVLDFIELEDGIYTVMDFIPGESFQSLIDKGRKFSQKEALKYATQLAEVLEYLHSRNPQIIHGDIKPDNLMLTPEDNICLIDFNISGIVEYGGAVVKGYTAGYAAPEQIRSFRGQQENLTDGTEIIGSYQPTEILKSNEYQPTELLKKGTVNSTELITPGKQSTASFTPKGDLNKDAAEEASKKAFVFSNGYKPAVIDARADIYSAMATIYHILTGVRPAERTDVGFRSPKDINPKVSEGFDFIICKAMEADPNKRFQSASALLKALRDVRKLEGRYKKLVRRQNLLMVCSLLLIWSGIIMVFAGRRHTELEGHQTYQEYISRMENINKDVSEGVKNLEDTETEFEECYEAAVQMGFDSFEPYYQKAYYLYNANDYKGFMSYVDNEIMEYGHLAGDKEMAGIWYMYGCCLENQDQPDLNVAINAFENAVRADPTKNEYYRELAIACAKCGKMEQSEEALQQARDNGLENDNLFLVQGELSLAKGNYPEAASSFERCLDITDSDDIRLRAYLGYHSSVTGEEKNEKTLLKSSDMLERSRTQLPAQMQLQTLHSLAQDYMDLFSITGEKKYAQSALDILGKIESSGWGDYTSKINRAFLHEQLGEFDRSEEILQELLAEDQTNYVTYKRLAFLEADIQNAKEDGKRDYTSFREYCERAGDLYQNGKVNDDLEMQLLDQMISDLDKGK